MNQEIAISPACNDHALLDHERDATKHSDLSQGRLMLKRQAESCVQWHIRHSCQFPPGGP